MFINRSISKKIIVVVIFLIFFFGTLATYFVFYNTQNALIDVRKKLLVTNLVSEANEIAQVLVNTENISTTLAAQEKVVNYLNKVF